MAAQPPEEGSAGIYSLPQHLLYRILEQLGAEDDHVWSVHLHLRQPADLPPELRQAYDRTLEAYLDHVGGLVTALALDPIHGSPGPILTRLPALRDLSLCNASLRGCEEALAGLRQLTGLAWQNEARQQRSAASLQALPPGLRSLELALAQGRSDLLADCSLGAAFGRMAGTLTSLSLTLGSYVRGAELSEALGRLTTLQTMHLTLTNVAQLHPGSWATRLRALRSLSIFSAAMVRMWAGLALLPALEALSLEGSVSISPHALDVWRCPHLTSLRFGFLAFDRLHDEAEASLPSLEELALEHVSYCTDDEFALGGPAGLAAEAATMQPAGQQGLCASAARRGDSGPAIALDATLVERLATLGGVSVARSS
eukprot:scaffold14.g1334.t1